MIQRYLCGLLLGAALPLHAAGWGDPPPGATDGWVTPVDYYVFSCMREYTKLHSLPDFDASTSFGVDSMSETSTEVLVRLGQHAAAYARTLRAPDYQQQEDHGLAPVLALCQHESRKTRVAVLAREPGAPPQFCDAQLEQWPAQQAEAARRFVDGMTLADARGQAQAWMQGEASARTVTDPLRGGRKATLLTVTRECRGSLIDEQLDWRLALLADAQGRVYARELRALLPDARRFAFRGLPLHFEYVDSLPALEQALPSLANGRMSPELFEREIAPTRELCLRESCGGRLTMERSADGRTETWRYTPDPARSLTARLAGKSAQRVVEWSFDEEGLLDGVAVK